MEERIYTVQIEPCEEGGYWAYVPALPGCFTQGESLELVITAVREAIEGFIQALADEGEAIPFEKQFPSHSTLGIRVAAPINA